MCYLEFSYTSEGHQENISSQNNPKINISLLLPYKFKKRKITSKTRYQFNVTYHYEISLLHTSNILLDYTVPDTIRDRITKMKSY